MRVALLGCIVSLLPFTAYATPTSFEICDVLKRLSIVPRDLTDDYGTRTGHTREELRAILRPPGGSTSVLAQYRVAREFVANIKNNGKPNQELAVKAAYLFDLLTEVSRSSGQHNWWSFDHYRLKDGSHVFEGGEGSMRPLIIIRASDATLFKGEKSKDIPRETWKPNYGEMSAIRARELAATK